MRSIALYETAAGLLVAFYIANIVEMGLILPAILRVFDYARGDDLAVIGRQMRIASWVVVRAPIAFVLGEVAAVAVIAVGVDGWVPYVAFPVVLITLSVLLLTIVIAPLRRVMWEAHAFVERQR